MAGSDPHSGGKLWVMPAILEVFGFSSVLKAYDTFDAGRPWFVWFGYAATGTVFLAGGILWAVFRKRIAEYWPWHQLRVAIAELAKVQQENLELANSLNTARELIPAQQPSKLTIHSALYRALVPGGKEYDVTDCLRNMIAGDSLVLQIQNGNFWIGNINCVPKDPFEGQKKWLQVEYSFDGGPTCKIERREDYRLVLPEDTALKTELAALKTGKLVATSRPVETIYMVSFDYLPLSPLEKGWTQVYNPDGMAEFGTDPDIPGSLRMKILKSEVAIHHNLPPHAALADHLEFTAKYTNNTMIFTRLNVGTKDGSVQKQVDIKYYYGELHTAPTNPDPGCDPNKGLPEQTIYWPAQVLSGGRLAFNIDLREAVNLSLGAQGWVFKSISGVRLRGNLSISPLVLSKMQQT